MSQPAEGPGAPLLGHHRASPRAAYRRVVGAHRAPGLNSPSRGYLFTVALLAGTASMPILAAISAGSATVGNSALPDSSTPFIPTPSVGPVVIQGTQPPVVPTRTPVADAASLPALAAAPALPDDADLGSRRRPRPTAPAKVPSRPRPTIPPRPSPVPSPSPSASDPATPDPTPSPTAEPTSTLSEPATDPSTTPSAQPSATTSPDNSPPPTSAPPEETPGPTLRPTAEPGPSATVPATHRLRTGAP
ncbi:hypothetical protein [Micromonospora sp. NPDC047738]|uniref:hypothetical protein n=1 Tax=unclassified Micromonospora TaxID=2617518 RepID=UPI0033E4D0A4